jgi:hypothetical protein
MDYQTAKSRVQKRRIVGAIILLIGALYTTIGLLLFLYHSLDGGSPALSSLSLAIKRLVYAIFERTQIFRHIWDSAPTPNPRDLTSPGSIGFLACYLITFFGASLIGSANQLARRLRVIDRQIEDQAIRESIKGRPRRPRVEIEQQIDVSKQSVWKEAHTLYVAPLVVGLILWAIGKLIG